jgi:hypothetical protein
MVVTADLLLNSLTPRHLGCGLGHFEEGWKGRKLAYGMAVLRKNEYHPPSSIFWANLLITGCAWTYR